MEHILEDILGNLYLGRVIPKDYTKPDTPKYDEFVKYAASLEENLTAKLKEEEKELYRKLRENIDIIYTLEKMRTFVVGYKLGSQITLETMR